jgi:hypothetical protein
MDRTILAQHLEQADDHVALGPKGDMRICKKYMWRTATASSKNCPKPCTRQRAAASRIRTAGKGTSTPTAVLGLQPSGSRIALELAR